MKNSNNKNDSLKDGKTLSKEFDRKNSDIAVSEEKNGVSVSTETKNPSKNFLEKEKFGSLDTVFGVFVSPQKNVGDVSKKEKSDNCEKTEISSSADEKKKSSLFDTDEKKNKKEKKIGKEKSEKTPSYSSEKKENFFVKFSKKYWWSYLIAVAVIVIVITVTVVVLTKDFINIYDAEDFANIEKGNIFVLKKDITVDGDLSLSVPYPINFNGHILTVTGTLSVNTDSESDFYYGSEKDAKEKTEKSKLVVGNLTINALKSDFTMRVAVESGKIDITTNSFVSEKTFSSPDITFNSLSVVLYKTAGTANGTMNILGSDECSLSNVLSDIYALNSNIKVNSDCAVKNIVLDGSSLDLYGKADNITGGTVVHFRQNAYALSVKDTETLKSYDYALPDLIDGGVNIVNIITLSKPWNITFTQINGGLYCLFPSVSNATGYEISVDGKDPFVFSFDSDNSTVSVNLTDYINTAGEHTVTVKAISDDENFIASESISATYVFTSKLVIPSGIKTYEENGRILISFDKVPFADNFVIKVTSPSGEVTSFTVKATSDATQSYDITNYIQSGTGLYGITVSSSSDYPDYYSASDEAVLSFAKYEKLEAPFLVFADNILSITGDPNSLAYEIYENGVLKGTTKNSQFALNDAVSGSVVTVKAIGHGFYTESDFAQIIVP